MVFVDIVVVMRFKPITLYKLLSPSPLVQSYWLYFLSVHILANKKAGSYSGEHVLLGF